MRSSLTPFILALNILGGIHIAMSMKPADNVADSIREKRGVVNMGNTQQLTPRGVDLNLNGMKLNCSSPKAKVTRLIFSGPDTSCK